MNLYEIDAAIRRVLDNGFNGEVDEETGEVIELGASDLEALHMEKEAVLENTAMYYKELAAMAFDIREEEKALAERRKRLEAKAERIGQYLMESLMRDGRKRFSSVRVEIKLTPSKRVVIDEDRMPMEWFRTKTTYEPMKAEIKKAISEGKMIAGAAIEAVTNYNIK